MKPTNTKEELRKKINAQVAEYLANGGKITQCPPMTFNNDSFALAQLIPGRVHLQAGSRAVLQQVRRLGALRQRVPNQRRRQGQRQG